MKNTKADPSRPCKPGLFDRTETKAALGLAFLAALLEPKVAALFGHALSAWLVFKVHNTWTVKHLRTIIKETDRRMSELLAKEDADLTESERLKKSYLEDLDRLVKEDENTIKLSSYLLGFATFVNPIFGALFLGGSIVARKAEYRKHMLKIEEFLDPVLEDMQKEDPSFVINNEPAEPAAT